LQIALSFGGFQAVMPLVGALAGLSMKKYFAGYDHWVAFALLSAVGGKMLYESFKIGPNDKNLNPTNILVLLILSVATSIDALAVGFTLSILVRSVAVAVTIIGLTTFVLSYIGVFVGKKFGHLFESKIEAAGGLILIGLGVKIVLEHTLL
jgi:putative Mn2+ efflux pump MntP